MSVSLEYLQRCSVQTGYAVPPLEKVVRLGEMAGEIARHPFLRNVLALKGGTALNLCFGPPKRLSVDLDYNYIGHAEKEKMLKDRPQVEKAIAELATRRQYHIQASAEAFAGRKIYLVYQSVLGANERIEVDLNYLFRVPLAGIEQQELWQPGDLDRFKVRTVSLAEVVTGKLLAMLDRGAARDVWDVANLPAPAADILELPSFRRLFIALTAVLDHPLSTYTLSRLQRLVTERTVAEQLAPMLAVTSLPQTDALVKRAWAILNKFLNLKANETAYLASIERGDLRPELLFGGDRKAAQRIATHPAILWKVSNVRAYRTRNEKKHGSAVLDTDAPRG